MNLPETWRAVDAKEASAFQSELQREVSAAHPLFKTAVRCVARRVDRDDFLFECLEEKGSSPIIVGSRGKW
jgi:hypothetical protein